MIQLVLAIRWYVVVQIFGLAALPLGLCLFRHLPDQGYGVTKPLGLLLTGWTFWLLTTFGWTYNTVGGILVALIVLLVSGLFLLHRVPGIRYPRRSTVLVTELVFAGAFAGWCLVRAHMPRIQTAGGEKWMEIAFLRAILRSETFPPHDPWLSGFAISYYYFGYVLVAMITRLSSVPPSIAFNLSIAALFALTCTGAYSLVYNLLAASRSFALAETPKDRANGNRLTRFALWGGLLGPVLVAVMGNLEGLLESLHARGVGSPLLWRWLDIRSINTAPPAFAEGSWEPQRFFWWWQASRVVHDYAPWGAEQEVIDEFPAFSFILGDMHPHVLALPFVLLALALALNLYLQVTRRQSSGADIQPPFSIFSVLRSFPLTGWEFFIYAVCLGGLGFLNTWDFPIYLFVVVAAYTLATLLRTTSTASSITHYLLHFVLFFVSLLALGIVLYLPFWIGFQSQAGGILINLFNSTRVPQFIVMFGPLLFVAVVFVLDRAWRSGVRTYSAVKWTVIAIASVVGVLTVLLGIVTLLVWLGVIPSQGRMGTYISAWLYDQPIPGVEGVRDVRELILYHILLHLLANWTAFGLLAFLTIIVLSLVHKLQSPPVISEFSAFPFVLLLLATGALLTLGVEYVYLRDHFGTRMNTVFKFYFQAWVVWGVAGACALVSFARRGGRWWVIAGVALLLVGAGIVYPVLAIPARAREYGGPPTLDGAAHLAETYPADYAAIAWINEYIDGAPVILETPGDQRNAYTYEGRISAHTGLPTVLGWAGHEHQWRGTYDEQARRAPDIETLYTSIDADEVLTLVDKYGISYVYVGPVERARYSAAGLAKFAGLFDPVYETDVVTIYRVSDDQLQDTD